jgi:hypothetical protein
LFEGGYEGENFPLIVIIMSFAVNYNVYAVGCPSLR